MSFKRNELHYNFLKTIILRIDFEGVFEPELEIVLPKIKPYLKGKGFIKYEKKESNQIEINVIDGKIASQEMNKIQNQTIHSFTNDTKGFTLDISNSFICLTISSLNYFPFEDYSVLVSDITDVCKNNIDFFTIKRVGIRKINICMIKNKENICKFFLPEYFSYFNKLSDTQTFMSTKKDFFSINNFKINLSSEIQQGMAEGEELYRLSLDIDNYIDEAALIDEETHKTDNLNNMNNLIFEIYMELLTNDFKNALANKDEKFFEELIGVESNGE